MVPEKTPPTLFGNPSECCGCGACATRCPKGAISMREDESGFVYPEIDPGRCVACGACVRTCGFKSRAVAETAGPWYAACARDGAEDSASGGAFYALAREVVSSGGIAFGAAYAREGGGMRVRHAGGSTPEGLRPLQGSKYVQSDAAACFPEVLAELKTGRPALFSGTPCQVAGLRGFLGRDWPNLVTVDLVCHGVPSGRMFASLVSSLERRHGKRVVDFRFRCKRNGWGHSLLLLLLRPFDEDGPSRDEEVLVPAGDSPYYDLFLRFKTLRDSCYSCPFAGKARPGDLTVGDFWGVNRNRPDVLADPRFGLERGVSCLLVNTERGRRAIERFGGLLELFEVSFDDIAKGNDQLRHPSELPSDRGLYLAAFRDGDWEAVESLWRRRERGARYRLKRLAKTVLPPRAVAIAKDILRKG